MLGRFVKKGAVPTPSEAKPENRESSEKKEVAGDGKDAEQQPSAGPQLPALDQPDEEAKKEATEYEQIFAKKRGIRRLDLDPEKIVQDATAGLNEAEVGEVVPKRPRLASNDGALDDDVLNF